MQWYVSIKHENKKFVTWNQNISLSSVSLYIVSSLTSYICWTASLSFIFEACSSMRLSHHTTSHHIKQFDPQSSTYKNKQTANREQNAIQHSTQTTSTHHQIHTAGVRSIVPLGGRLAYFHMVVAGLGPGIVVVLVGGRRRHSLHRSASVLSAMWCNYVWARVKIASVCELVRGDKCVSGLVMHLNSLLVVIHKCMWCEYLGYIGIMYNVEYGS